MAELEGPPTIAQILATVSAELRTTRTELDAIRRELSAGHDVLVTAERVIADTLKHSAERERRRRFVADGACVNCAGPAYPGKTRCTPCGRRNSRLEREARQHKGTDPKGHHE